MPTRSAVDRLERHQDELEQHGERVDDVWVVAGQWIDDHDRLLAAFLGRGPAVGRVALILHFVLAGQPFPEPMCAARSKGAQSFSILVHRASARGF